jgi:hypothetical protein
VALLLLLAGCGGEGPLPMWRETYPTPKPTWESEVKLLCHQAATLKYLDDEEVDEEKIRKSANYCIRRHAEKVLSGRAAR